MSSTEYATPLSLEIRPSWRLSAFFALSHAGALALLPLTSVPGWLILAAGAVIVASLLRLVAQFALLVHPRAIERLEWPAGNEWQLFSRDGSQLSGHLLPHTYVHPWLMVLVFRADASRRSIVIIPDMVDANTFRRLRVRLRLNPPGSPPMAESGGP